MPRSKCDKFLMWATVILMFAACYYIIIPAFKKIHEERTRIVSSEIKAKMKYHGASVCFEQRGVHWFYDKKGRRCRL
jgi:hypothetical protein